MGFFWDLLQQNQIDKQDGKVRSLKQRVEQLERDLEQTRRLLHVVLQRLETHLGQDINRDGKVG